MHWNSFVWKEHELLQVKVTFCINISIDCAADAPYHNFYRKAFTTPPTPLSPPPPKLIQFCKSYLSYLYATQDTAVQCTIMLWWISLTLHVVLCFGLHSAAKVIMEQLLWLAIRTRFSLVGNFNTSLLFIGISCVLKSTNLEYAN